MHDKLDKALQVQVVQLAICSAVLGNNICDRPITLLEVCTVLTLVSCDNVSLSNA